MNNIPIIKEIKTILVFLYRNDSGNNLHNEIFNIIPDIMANNIPKIVLLIYFFKKIKVMKAPNTSDIPEIKVYVKALVLLFVE